MTEISYQILMMLTCQTFKCLKYFLKAVVKSCTCVYCGCYVLISIYFVSCLGVGPTAGLFCEIVEFLVSDKSSCVGFNLCYYCKYSLSPVWCLKYFDAFSSLPYDLNFKINSDGKVQHTDPY